MLSLLLFSSAVTSLPVTAFAAEIYSAVGATSGETGKCTWNFDEATGTLTISGNGYMESYYSYVAAPWISLSVKHAVIENGVTTIGESAFSGCSGLTTITIPDSVTNISDFAFKDCTGLTSVTIPGGVERIGAGVFHGCTELTSVTIPDSVTSIGEKAFGYIDYFGYRKNPLFTIYGKKGSQAESYANENDFTFIETESLTVVTGDVNGDGKVNGADAGLLNRYTSGWEGYSDKIKDMDAADLNGDGKVNGADAGILNRYTSGWQGYDKYIKTVTK